MAERMIGLSVNTLFNGDHNHPGIPQFITGFSKTLYTGDGRRPEILNTLGVDVDFPVRLLVGVPKKDLTRPQRVLAEAYVSHHFGTPIGTGDTIWTQRPGWKPINASRASAPIDKSALDVSWMLQLGISKAIWENLILQSPDALTRSSKQHASFYTTTRQLLMLSVFGFSDPHQFFTSRPSK